MPSLLIYSFLLDSVEVVDYVLQGTKIELTRNNLSGNSCDIHIDLNVDDVKIPSVGQSIEVYRGVATATESAKFKGEVKNISIEDGKYILTCKDKLNQLKYNLFTTSYDINIDVEAGELSAIFKDIVEDGGFSASVVDSGTGSSDITVEKFISRRQSRLDRMRLISKILNWGFYYDYDNDWVRFEPKGYETYTTPFVVGNNIINSPRWNQNLESMRNSITVDGAFSEDMREENETGDGGTTVFYFTYEPEITELTLDGTLLTRGTTGSSTSYDYTVDKELRTYTFVTAPTIGQTIYMKYTTRIPTPVAGKNTASITLYGLEQEEAFEFKDLVTVEDAETRLAQLLELLSWAEISTELITDEYDVKPGMKINVTDSNNPTKNGDYIVQSVIINYPEPFDTVKIGTEVFDVNSLFQTIDERLNALETKDNGLIEQLTTLLQLDREIKLERRYNQIESRSIAGVHIVGHPIYAAAGVYPIGTAPDYAAVQIVQKDNTYKEYIVDDDFYDSINSFGVTWNTTTKIIHNAGMLYFKPISLGHAFTYFTLKFPSWTTGVLEITADNGASFQGASTLNTKTAFTSSDGTGIWLKIRAPNLGSADYENTYDDFGNMIAPAFELILED